MPKTGTVAAATAFTALAVADTVLAGRTEPASRRVRLVVKPLLMPALATAFGAGTRGNGDPLRRATFVAQAFSWGGDVALLGRSERAFLAGVGSFFGAHVAYVVGFGSARTGDRAAARRGAKVAGGLWLAAAPLMTVAAGRRSRRFAVPIAGYAALLAAMFGASTTMDPVLPRRARQTLRAGTTLFLVSDTLLGVQEFMLPERSPRLEQAVMATYTAGQGLIAWGVAQA